MKWMRGDDVDGLESWWERYGGVGLVVGVEGGEEED